MRNQYYYSQISVAIGQKLIKRYGLWSSIRYLKNLGFAPETVCEYLALIPRKD